MDSLLMSRPFLLLGHPSITTARSAEVPDTSILVARDFDVDPHTGFMPPQPPVYHLPVRWKPWEVALQDAMELKLKLGDNSNLSAEDAARSASWRTRVLALPILPTADLRDSEILLRRAHLVLVWIMHFYIHTLPPHTSIRIPPPLTVPLLQVCSDLQLPPVLTYSDHSLYNWAINNDQALSGAIHLDNLRCPTLFTGTTDEQEFFLTSSCIELRGAEALQLMLAVTNETLVGESIATTRIITLLQRLAVVIHDLKDILVSVKHKCDPDVFYNDIRPWLRGEDPSRKWVFEGLDLDPALQQPTKLSGSTAGQSTLIHALDVFLGVDEYSRPKNYGDSQPSSESRPTFLSRMQSYMPRLHRAFLDHLLASPRPLRDIVTAGSPAMREAYSQAVLAPKEFRDAHMIIVTLYVIGPARRAATRSGSFSSSSSEGQKPLSDHILRGTGGTDLAKFLKEVRDRTAGSLLS